jgi:hypothetical protein
MWCALVVLSRTRAISLSHVVRTYVYLVAQQTRVIMSTSSASLRSTSNTVKMLHKSSCGLRARATVYLCLLCFFLTWWPLLVIVLCSLQAFIAAIQSMCEQGSKQRHQARDNPTFIDHEPIDTF